MGKAYVRVKDERMAIITCKLVATLVSDLFVRVTPAHIHRCSTVLTTCSEAKCECQKFQALFLVFSLWVCFTANWHFNQGECFGK